jgi:hypothetical protein
MAMYEIARLYGLGFIHGDIHMSNIIFSPRYEHYFLGRTGRAFIIDFGRTFLIQRGTPSVSESEWPTTISWPPPPPPPNPEHLYSTAVVYSILLDPPNPVYAGIAFTWEAYQWLKVDDFEAADGYLYTLFSTRL